MSETNTVGFSNLKPVVKKKKNKIFTVIGKELNEQQTRAGYYLSIMAGDSIEGYFNGLIKEITRDGKVQTEVELKGDDKEETLTRINASKGLLDQLANIEIGAPVRLAYGGKKKLKNGNTFHVWEVSA